MIYKLYNLLEQLEDYSYSLGIYDSTQSKFPEFWENVNDSIWAFYDFLDKRKVKSYLRWVNKEPGTLTKSEESFRKWVREKTIEDLTRK